MVKFVCHHWNLTRPVLHWCIPPCLPALLRPVPFFPLPSAALSDLIASSVFETDAGWRRHTQSSRRWKSFLPTLLTRTPTHEARSSQSPRCFCCVVRTPRGVQQWSSLPAKHSGCFKRSEKPVSRRYLSSNSESSMCSQSSVNSVVHEQADV